VGPRYAMKRLLASCFGLGWLPLAPGTWGSLPPAIIFALLCYFKTSTLLLSIAMVVLALVGSIVCVKFAPAVIAETGDSDPAQLVADEFAGQALTLIAVLAVHPQDAFFATAIAFLLFRIFDLLKPWPVYKFEVLPAGWGILADDLAAGIYASLAFNICILLNIPHLLTAFVPQTGNVSISQGAVLGIVQGLTEFLPVSSKGHLVLFEHFFGLNAESEQMLAFDLSVHVGTVVAIFYVFHRSIKSWFRNLADSRKYGPGLVQIYKRSPGVRVLILAFIANVATAAVGLPLKEQFQQARANLWVVAAMWIITATFLVVTDLRKHARLGLRQFGISAALIVGIAQATALMPAISRSCMTICAAVLIGLHRRWAVEFSFLCGVPAILGAAGIEFVKYHKVILQSVSVGSVIVGPITAAIVGVLALKILIKALRRAKFKYFGLYCYALAGFLMLYLLFKA
jgi:undecaprenyl-diphosphatase